VPFGEYMPWRPLLERFLTAIDLAMADFSRGAPDQPLLQGAGHAVGTSICYEVAFGEEIIRALPDAALLVNVSNDGWFGDSLAPHQHLEIARMRARETGRYLLRATNTGISAIIDERGRVVQRSPQFEVAVLTGPVQPRSWRHPLCHVGELAGGERERCWCWRLWSCGVGACRAEARQQLVSVATSGCAPWPGYPS
jgi:apolipoprotein N-acyltransferase